MKMFAKFGAILVPIATPCTCRKERSQKVKQLYLSIKFSPSSLVVVLLVGAQAVCSCRVVLEQFQFLLRLECLCRVMSHPGMPGCCCLE